MKPKRPVRVAVYDSIPEAEEAISQLLAAGFAKHDLSVICSEQAVADHFIEQGLEDRQPADVLARAGVGGAIGSTVGGLAFLGLATSAGSIIVALGPLVPAIISGGIAGSFLGAMTSRGVDPDAADFYDQSVETGKLLVVAEDHSEKADRNLSKAEQIFANSGAVPIPLMEG
jgi:hypothetical protein